jgi:hypothetical protein
MVYWRKKIIYDISLWYWNRKKKVFFNCNTVLLSFCSYQLIFTFISGDLFDMLLPMLCIYQEYVRNHHYSLQVLAEYKQKPEFNALLKRYEEKPMCEGRSVEVFLTYPMHQVYISNIVVGPSWLWSYGSWIYNYICTQCLSPLTFSSNPVHGEVYSIQHYVIKFVRNSGFLHQYNWPPWYNWNIVESDIKHHKQNPITVVTWCNGECACLQCSRSWVWASVTSNLRLWYLLLIR